jgi:hypothetical protein
MNGEESEIRLTDTGKEIYDNQNKRKISPNTIP